MGNRNQQEVAIVVAVHFSGFTSEFTANTSIVADTIRLFVIASLFVSKATIIVQGSLETWDLASSFGGNFLKTRLSLVELIAIMEVSRVVKESIE